MKKILMTILAMAAASAVLPCFASQGSVLLTISTKGPDCYADDTPVQDGERYAVVWTRSGATFSGITVQGTAAGDPADNEVLTVKKAAENGHCKEFIYEIPEGKVSNYVGKGTFSVHLLDTRTAEGTPGGKKVGVNGFSDSQSDSRSADSMLQSVSTSGANHAAVASIIPDSIAAPKIKSIEVKNGIVRLTVEKTSKLLRYGVSSGDDPATLAADATFPKKDGNDGADIVIEAPAKGSGGFFKVGRAPLR